MDRDTSILEITLTQAAVSIYSGPTMREANLRLDVERYHLTSFLRRSISSNRFLAVHY